MARPVTVEAEAVSKNPDTRGDYWDWVVVLDILWSGEDRPAHHSVEVYGRSPEEAQARSEWVLGAIQAAMEEEWP